MASLTAFASVIEPAKPIDRPPPSYPDRAGNSLGHVKIQFTIDANGRVQDPQVLESAPPGLFDAAALDAMKAWRYEPRRVDGQAVTQPNNMIALDFAPGPVDPAHTAVMINAGPAYYPREAYQKGLEGDVTVSFDIDQNGIVKNAKAIHSTVPEIFDGDAVSSIKNSRFRPVTVNGMSVGAEGLSVTVPFRLADAVLAPKRIDHTSLTYPPRALKAGEQGYCYVVFAIAGDGSVEKFDVVVTSPADVFRQACIDYATGVKFEAPDADPTGRVSRKHTMEITFQFDNSRPLLSAGQWVKIRYTLGTGGQIRNPEVVAASDSGIYTPNVLEAIRRRRVKPAIENGVAVEKPDQILIVSGD
ncbi:MAG: TonB family protein [Aliidongia sp.]